MRLTRSCPCCDETAGTTYDDLADAMVCTSCGAPGTQGAPPEPSRINDWGWRPMLTQFARLRLIADTGATLGDLGDVVASCGEPTWERASMRVSRGGDC